MTRRTFNSLLRLPVAALLFAVPFAVHADAGHVLFLYGTAHVQSVDGKRDALAKGQAVESGDTIVTGANGRVQLRMADGGLLALRPQTEFHIEDFNYPRLSSVSTASAGEARSFYSLVKGGFRSITGAIGKKDKSAYRVRTPVATIGIRGTDYTAVFCAGDCGDSEGLFLGVTEGGVTVRNDAGSLDLDPGQYGHVAGAQSAPSISVDAAQVLAGRLNPESSDEALADADSEAEAPTVATAATDASGNEVDLQGGGQVANDDSGAVAFSGGVSGAGASNASYDESGNVVGFSKGDSRYELGDGTVVNAGRDADREGATGLSWGRWDGGTVTDSDGNSEDVDGLHWVAGQDGAARPELPTEGTREFALIGNTNPTDSDGNVGTLGSASLSADFTDQTVDADVNVSFDETRQVWDAQARDVDMNSADATFGGEFDNVTVTDTDSGSSVAGSGDLSGFFSGDADGELSGAGLSYSLSDGDDTTVDGAAAFEVVE